MPAHALSTRSAGARWPGRVARLGRALACALVCLVARAAPATLYTLPAHWIDEGGRRVELAQWRQRTVLVVMEYSECRFICSAYWLKLLAVQRRADEHHRDVEFVVLSIDPEHDSPVAWRDYRRVRKLDRSNWHFLTATPPETRQAAALLGVHWWFEEGHLMHDFRIVRLGPDGRTLAAMTNYDQAPDMLFGSG